MTSSESPGPSDEQRHPAASVEEWLFTAWLAQPAVGADLGVSHRRRRRPGTGRRWLATGAPLLHVADWHVPLRSDPLLVKGDGLWAEHTCDAPMEQWTVTNETYAAALDDPDDALGRAYGVPTALSWDLEWYATDQPTPRAVAGLRRTIEQAGVVHGEIEIGGADPIHLVEAPAHRWHRWGDAARSPSNSPRRSPTPVCALRSPSRTGRSPIGCSRRTAGGLERGTS